VNGYYQAASLKIVTSVSSFSHQPMAHPFSLTVAGWFLALTTFGQDAQPEYTST